MHVSKPFALFSAWYLNRYFSALPCPVILDSYSGNFNKDLKMLFKFIQWVDILKSFGEIEACESGLFFRKVQAKLRKWHFENTEVVAEGDMMQCLNSNLNRICVPFLSLSTNGVMIHLSLWAHIKGVVKCSIASLNEQFPSLLRWLLVRQFLGQIIVVYVVYCSFFFRVHSAHS